MKQLIIIVVVILGGLFVVHEAGKPTTNPDAIVEQEMDDQTKNYVANVSADKYSRQEIKELYSVFKGCELYIDVFEAEGSKNTGDLIDNMKLLIKKLDTGLGDNLKAEFETRMAELIGDAKSDTENIDDFADRKNDIKNECFRIAKALKFVGENYDAQTQK